MKRHLSLLLTIAFSLNFNAQPVLDSLKNELQKIDDKKKEVAQLIKISFEYTYIDTDSSFLYANKAYDLSKKENYSLGIAESRLRQSSCWVKKNNYKKAETLLNEALKLYIQLKDTTAIAGTYANFGGLYFESEDLDKAAKFFIKSSLIYEKQKNKKRMASIQLSIGNVFYMKNNYNIALEHYSKAYLLYKEFDDLNGISMTTANIGVIYHIQENYEKALENYKISMKQDTALGHMSSLGINLNNAGSTLIYLNRLGEAEKYLFGALKLHRKYNYEGRKAYAYEYLGELYSKKNNFGLAKIYFDSCIVLAEILERSNQKARAYEALAKNYIKQGDYKNAYNNLRLYATINDSIVIINKEQQVSDLLIKYESEKNKREILQLDYENKMNEVELVEAKTEKAQLILLLGGILLLVITIGIVLWQRYKNKQTLANKDKELLENNIIQLKKDKELASFNSLIQGQEEERKRIAAELHDSIGSMLSTVKLNYGMLKNKTDKNYLVTENLLDDACNEVRRVAHNMMPEALLKFGLIEAINDLIAKINQTQTINIDLIVLGSSKKLNPTTELYLYRIVQELINNILKHAKATDVIIQINQREDLINIMVEDNGIGFKSENSTKEGLGLKNINSRIDVLKGSISFDSEPKKGCIVMIDVPCMAA